MKTYAQYLNEYEQLIDSRPKSNSLIVKSHIWIYFKFTEENNIEPNTERYYKCIDDVKQYDKELYSCLIKAHNEIAKAMK